MMEQKANITTLKHLGFFQVDIHTNVNKTERREDFKKEELVFSQATNLVYMVGIQSFGTKINVSFGVFLFDFYNYKS